MKSVFSYEEEMKRYNDMVKRVYEERIPPINYFVMDHTQSLCATHPSLIESIKESVDKEYIVFDPSFSKKESNPENEKEINPTTNIILSPKRSFEAAKAYKGKKVAVLNFANNHNIGGSPWHANAQEECLCRISTLYPCLKAKEEDFYEKHRKEYTNGIIDDWGSADLIYTPNVIVFKTDERVSMLLPESEWYETDVITCAAPVIYGSYDLAKYREVMQHRIDLILSVAKKEGVEVLILGAFGCGAFHNPPELVADIFKQALTRHHFGLVEFAIYDSHKEGGNLEVFKNVLGAD